MLALGACHRAPKRDAKAATIENFRSGMLAYLKARGDLCLGKEFPIDVSELEMQTGSRNALQMPVLEQAGLVVSNDAMGQVKTEDGSVPTKVRRYHLTDAGQRYYLSRPVPGETSRGGQNVVRSELCAAKLSLDKIVGFELTGPSDHPTALVSYTYQVDAAPWARQPDVQQVFPAVLHVIAGQSTAQLKEGFTLTESGWVANELVPLSSDSIAKR
jgi:hypothetical protein